MHEPIAAPSTISTRIGGAMGLPGPTTGLNDRWPRCRSSTDDGSSRWRCCSASIAASRRASSATERSTSTGTSLPIVEDVRSRSASPSCATAVPPIGEPCDRLRLGNACVQKTGERPIGCRAGGWWCFVRWGHRTILSPLAATDRAHPSRCSSTGQLAPTESDPDRLLVGMGRFELPASCSQSRRANQAALHPGSER